jgi:acetyl esterase/lipase
MLNFAKEPPMHWRIVGNLLAVLAVVVGASPVEAQAPKAKNQAKAKQQPPPIPEGVKVERDIEYARIGEMSLMLDIYRPESSDQTLPLVVWVHGGGWRAGDKANNLALPLSGRGYVVASINYRLSGVAPFPAQIEDCRAAIRWLRANAAKYGFDPKRIGVWGGSAGGHLVALLGTAGDVTRWDSVGGNTDQSARVQAVCDYYGPTDLLAAKTPGGGRGAESPVGRLLGGPVDEREDEARQASPVRYVTPDDPPFLIVHGEQDETVSIEQSELLEAALKKVGAQVTFIRVKNAGHGFRPDSDPSPEEIRSTVASFFDKHLK